MGMFALGAVLGAMMGFLVAALCTISALDEAKAKLEGLLGQGISGELSLTRYGSPVNEPRKTVSHQDQLNGEQRGEQDERAF